MATRKTRFRLPTADEQTVLREMQVELLLTPKNIRRCDRILIQEHYLHSAQLVGEQLRYAVVWRGQWLAVAAWSAAAFHLKARDAFIAWSEEQRRQRLPLVVNNSRLYVLAQHHYPNLISRFMKLMLGRLSGDWEQVWAHPVALAESFVDPDQYQGTAYKVSGWIQLGHTRGWKRSAVDFYEKHDHPKQVWVRELVKNACAKLRAPELPAPWAAVLPKARPRCTAKVREIASLMERLDCTIPEFRRQQGLVYPIVGMLALIAMATFSGVAKGYEDLADYAATLSQPQLRALKFRLDPHTRRVRCPERTTFERVLRAVDAQLLQHALLLWQEQVLGPVQDRLVIIDGKEIRHADVESVSAVDGTGRWLGSTLVTQGSNEIPAGRAQLAKLGLVGKIVLSDAAHTQVAHARQILYEQGGNYLMTVKKNQKDLYANLEKLFTQQRFSPSTHGPNPCDDAREQSRATRDPGAGLSGGLPGAGGLSRSPDHCSAPTTSSTSRQENY
jgi:predicted transposase YbfD/YdcC